MKLQAYAASGMPVWQVHRDDVTASHTEAAWTVPDEAGTVSAKCVMK
jgi:hypothetical protein